MKWLVFTFILSVLVMAGLTGLDGAVKLAEYKAANEARVMQANLAIQKQEVE